MAAFHVQLATQSDLAAIDAVHQAAFPTDLEARLVALLIEQGKATISLVALVNDQIAGHILFSPATLHCGPLAPRAEGLPTTLDSTTQPGLPHLPLAEQADHNGLGLAPVAVLPAYQNQGVGSALVRAGLAECRRLNIPWVVLLGHETYYPRFGFKPARNWSLKGDYGDSDAFQYLPLTTAADQIRGGQICYAPEFAEIFDEES